jgi:hypothetical protein
MILSNKHQRSSRTATARRRAGGARRQGLADRGEFVGLAGDVAEQRASRSGVSNSGG